MNWEKLVPGHRYAATGHDWGYLTALSCDASGDVLAVVLTRWPASFAGRGDLSFAQVAANVAVNTIRFPFGRGPGRPGMRTDGEIAAMFALAQEYAERYEAGEDLPGYAEWTYRRLPAGFGPPADVPPDAPRFEDNVKFLASGDANDCRYC